MIIFEKSHDYFWENPGLFSTKVRIIFQNLTHQYAWGSPQLVLKRRRAKRRFAPTEKKNDIENTSKYQKKKAIFGGYPPETKWLVPGLSGVVVGLL